MSKFTPVEAWQEFIELESLKEVRERLLPSLLEVGESRDLLLVTGENAGGKSLALLVINQLMRGDAKEKKISLTVMDVGMHRRTRSGVERAMMFGDEDTDSTGNISISVVKTGLKQIGSDRDGYTCLMLDEPDIGVGEGYHRAIGELILNGYAAKSEKCWGIVVVTHSRKLASVLLDAGASSLRVGEDCRPVQEWIANGEVDKTLEQLESLSDRTLQKSRDVRKMLFQK
jgi:hypothetical protein